MAASTSDSGLSRYHIPTWLVDNKSKFVPPVCNYMMHNDGRLKVMFVGGPNIRKDFHLEEGEEFFYMVKGDMNLVIQEHGKLTDIPIKEGEVFLLPGKIPHSPQRYSDTMGLVIERERMSIEKDCVRYFVGDTTETLYEEWFYCEDLGTQLGPVIKRYFASEQHKTGKPIPGTITTNPPFVPDSIRSTEKPFHLQTWIDTNMKEIQKNGRKPLWNEKYQSVIVALGEGEDKEQKTEDEEIWLWQVVGNSSVSVAGKTSPLGPQDTMLIKANSIFSHSRSKDSVCISVMMPWVNKDRAFAHLNLKKTD